MCFSDYDADLQNLTLDLLGVLQDLRASCLLPSSGRGKNLRCDLLRLDSAVESDDFDLDHTKPLLNAALANDLDDALIWDQVYLIIIESIPPP